MIYKINLPITTPWSKIVDWKAFGDQYDSIKLTRKHMSDEILDWLENTGLKPISCNMLTMFPDKNPPRFINSEWCETDNHAKIYWVYDVPVEYTWYTFKVPLGAANQDVLIQNPGLYEEAMFNDAPTGWIANPEVLEVGGTEIIMPGEVALLNIGTPHTIRVTSAARAKMFCVGLENKNKFVPAVNGMSFSAAKEIICSAQT